MENIITYEDLQKAKTEARLKKEEIKNQLPERIAKMAHLHYNEGKTFRQIAKEFGISHQRVHQLLSK